MKVIILNVNIENILISVTNKPNEFRISSKGKGRNGK